MTLLCSNPNYLIRMINTHNLLNYTKYHPINELINLLKFISSKLTMGKIKMILKDEQSDYNNWGFKHIIKSYIDTKVESLFGGYFHRGTLTKLLLHYDYINITKSCKIIRDALINSKIFEHINAFENGFKKFLNENSNSLKKKP